MPTISLPHRPRVCGGNLFDLGLALEVLTLDKVGDLVVVLTLLLLEVLVALSELAEGGQRVGAELVEDARDKLSKLLVLTVAVDGEGVGGDSGVDYKSGRGHVSIHQSPAHNTKVG